MLKQENILNIEILKKRMCALAHAKKKIETIKSNENRLSLKDIGL